MEPLSVGHRPQKPEENASRLLGGQAVNRPVMTKHPSRSGAGGQGIRKGAKNSTTGTGRPQGEVQLGHLFYHL